MFAAAAALCVAIIAVAAWVGTEIRPPREEPTPEPTGEVAVTEQDTLLLLREGPDGAPARGVTLVATSPDSDEALVLFLPVGTLVDIPGFGLDQLGLAAQYGEAALVEASVENLLGIDIDHVAGVSDSGLAALLARTGGLQLEVPDQLVARTDGGAAEVRFEPGEQFLDGERLVEYWSFVQRGESELDSLARQQLVWQALVRAVQDPDVLEALVADGAAPLDTSADAAFLESMFTRLATAADAQTLRFDLLPVTPFGSTDEDGNATYRPVPAGLERLREGPLAASVPRGGGSDAIRIQVLNGVGTPGIGQEVDARLEGTGVRIVLTDNARSFDFAETIILVYREDQRSLDAAELVQERLGVGTIQVSRQPQSVVDLTVVVGADFLEEEATQDPFPPSEEQSS